MQYAIELAQRGTGFVSPNPRVGCVIVRNDTVLSQGWHERYGEEHAEINALNGFRGPVDGTTMYVTLEPCCHQGKRGPCTVAILNSGIQRVVVGMIDPYHEVAGMGIEHLRSAGVEVIVGVCRQECLELNRTFVHYVTTQQPYIVGKIAQTITGHVHAASPNRWITSHESRVVVHEMRAEFDAVLTTSSTVLADDPELTTRLSSGRNPLRVVVDRLLRVPPHSKIVSSATSVATVTLCSDDLLHTPDAEMLRRRGVEVIGVKSDDSGLDPSAILSSLAKRNIASVLLECGPTMLDSFTRRNLVNELHVHTGPAPGFDGPRWKIHGSLCDFYVHAVRYVGVDVHVEYRKGAL